MDENPNLIKIREWVELDGRDDPDEWPAAPEYTEYRVEGQMRADVLARLGRDADDDSKIRLITGCIEGGYSEYTVEHDYTIEVWVDGDGHSQRIFDDETWESAGALPKFLRWLDGSAA